MEPKGYIINTTNIPGTGIYIVTPNGRKRFILNGNLGIALTANVEIKIYTNTTVGSTYTALSKVIPITRSQNPIFAAFRISTKGEVSLIPYENVPKTQSIIIDETYI